MGQRRRKRHGGGLDWRDWGTAWAERTWNMRNMSVTLDVLKVSGWLNPYARCRVERWASAVRGEVRDGSGRAYEQAMQSAGRLMGRLGADTGSLMQGRMVIVGGECSRRVRGGSRWRPAAHIEHVAHVRDAGGIPVGYVRIESTVGEEIAHVGDG